MISRTQESSTTRIESGSLSRQEADILVEQNEHVEFHSGFEYLRAHSGHRNGCLHLYIGDTHAGKSTLVRSLMLDMSTNFENDDQGALYLSEESVQQYKTALAYAVQNLPDLHVEFLSKFVVVSEVDGLTRNGDQVIDEIELVSKRLGIRALILDNITTSKIYQGTFSAQEARVLRLKKIAIERNIPIIIIAHTNTRPGDKKRMPNENDIRGMKTLPNLAEFLYIIEQCYIDPIVPAPDDDQGLKGKKQISIIHVKKHRNQTMLSKIYRLKYTSTLRVYGGDVPLDFETYKKIKSRENSL